MNCRHCLSNDLQDFLDLGYAPPSNAYLLASQLLMPERHYPLRLFVCRECWLVQTRDYTNAEDLFGADYAYFSSTSSGWLKHAADYVTYMTKRLGLGSQSFVVEVAANDGYLLRNFRQTGIPCLGIEPTASTAAAAEQLGIPVLREFFGEKLGLRLAETGRQADLIIGNNVYAHVPDINDFTRGLKQALKPNGTITIEFPHVLQLMKQIQFDTVYHEHFSYLSLYTVKCIFEKFGLKVIDVETLATHGGSLRVYGSHEQDLRQTSSEVDRIMLQEHRFGLRNLVTYSTFQAKADRIKDDLLLFLIEAKRAGKCVAAYGAAAKGNTLLNYGGVKPDLLRFVCDAAVAKQGKYMPGSHLPIYPPSTMVESRPDYVLILPWNIAEEVMNQLSFIRQWGGKFVRAVPQLSVQ